MDPHDTVLIVVDPPERAEAARHLLVLVRAAAAAKVPVVLSILDGQAAPGALLHACRDAGAATLVRPWPTPLHPGTLEHLDTAGRRRVLVCGAETHVAVHLLARDLHAEGFITAVAHDACSAARAEDHAAGLALCRDAGTAVTTSATVLAEWLGRAHADTWNALRAELA